MELKTLLTIMGNGNPKSNYFNQISLRDESIKKYQFSVANLFGDNVALAPCDYKAGICQEINLGGYDTVQLDHSGLVIGRNLAQELDLDHSPVSRTVGVYGLGLFRTFKL